MKRLLALTAILFIAVALLAVAKPGYASGSGDLNGDGALTSADQDLLRDYLLGKQALTAPQQDLADLTGDGEINVADLVRVVKLLRPLTLNLPGDPPVPLVMVSCPAGNYLMGRYAGEQNSSSNESPRHRVTLSRWFGLGRYEVTKRQWQAVMGTAPWAGQERVSSDLESAAVYVSWNDIAGAGGFIEKLNQHLASTGQGALVRLPTESEWEYACRAGTTTRFYWGDDLAGDQIGAYAWYEGEAFPPLGAFAHGVGLKRGNLWGLYDVEGNAWEWCQDWSGAYVSGEATDPTGPAAGTMRILRGGGWVSPTTHCRAAYRLSRNPDLRTDAIGFRLALSY